ncbi:MAG: sulfite exporter TauE/SafE family protein [Oligoflexia bacterium]|nr:sulfite exporter TauE/SafE family protein [Oligoflexia bacterium]
MEISILYFPTALALGALHALEPGHAKTLTAAYLIGIKGTKTDAALLGVSVAFTHSIIVIGLSVLAVLLGREAFTDEATYALALGSSVLVIVLGVWLLSKRLRVKPKPSYSVSQHHHGHGHTHHHQHDHEHLSDDEHARAHAQTLPDYVYSGERPSKLQVIAFGAAGGLVPCPAAISVMLLSLSMSQSEKGLVLVLGFSLGLALTLVGIGLLVVSGIGQLSASKHFSQFGRKAPVIAAALVIFSGLLGLVSAILRHA